MQDQDRIRRRAHDIWEREGRSEGRSAEHWTQACREIEAEGTAASGSSPTPTASDHGGTTQGQAMRLEGIEVLVVECLGGRILDGAVQALSLAVGPKMVRLGQAVLDAVLVAATSKMRPSTIASMPLRPDWLVGHSDFRRSAKQHIACAPSATACHSVRRASTSSAEGISSR
jgi:hypothetical protein